MLDRTVAPPILDSVDFDLKLKKYDHFLLDNQTPVYMINAGAEEVASIEWVFNAGNCFEAKNLVASATNHLIKNGTKTESSFEISEFFDFYGAYLGTGCSNETAIISLSCLSKHLPILLPKVAELITASVFPEKELSIYLQNQKQRLTISLQKGDFVANRLIDVYLYGENHPYGKFTSLEALNAINREDLCSFYSDRYVNGNCQIFIAGRLPSNIEQLLNNNFGNLPFVNKKASSINYLRQPATEKNYTIHNDENAVQGAIRLGRPFPNRHSEDWSKMQVLNTVFGGYFGSRLMSNIREEKGYTYGIHSYVQSHVNESALIISTEAGKDVCQATIEEVWKEAKILREELIDEEELQLVRNYMVGSVMGSLDGPFQIIGRWKNYILNGLDDRFFYKSLDTIKTITPNELQELANKYLTEEHFYHLTVF
ncbi:M16 family metallopeptidase [Arachidicoccus soli]|uniref:Insulinase family protein n=1 Tax=Arachidicoccus soli TaxID=2341117 RepID=A0A386HP74_9BACT|nr:pitrilysin family protein [Arachidicoccus soli]AYD47241.1 insulinase family protein [Arachidicoccus soli]